LSEAIKCHSHLVAPLSASSIAIVYYHFIVKKPV
jgi:hypothetical protein